MWYLFLGMVVLLLFYILFTYNSLVKSKNLVNESFSTMDVYLKKRWELIPSLLEIVKGYIKYENGTLEEIINLRNSYYDKMNNNQKIDINNRITDNVSELMILVEDYPELRASDNFKDLSKNLSQIEDEIANSRKYYNGTVRLFNNKVQMFPNNIIAFLFNLKKQRMYEANIDERKNIKIEV